MFTEPERTYSVKRMTCGHCGASVVEAVEQLHGTAGVEVELETGRLTVRGDGFSDEAVARAVEEAGYSVVGAR